MGPIAGGRGFQVETTGEPHGVKEAMMVEVEPAQPNPTAPRLYHPRGLIEDRQTAAIDEPDR